MFPGRYRVERERLLAELKARVPSVRLNGGQRSGLTEKQRVRFLGAIEPASMSNPWGSAACRARNFLILRLLYDLGIRRGELLAVRLEDIDVRQCRLSVRRRPDNPKDPRRRQPVAKTEERILEIQPDLAADLSRYILASRQALPAARKHGFLFIDTRHGAPLSASGLDKIFTQFRTVDGLPADLTSHVLRHDWNDRFSALMDTKGVKPGDEQRLRMYLQGWTWTGSAQRYNRRHIIKRSNEALLMMQTRSDGHVIK
ncbi:site-specific integrase [Caulobacter sp. BE254]|uniref:tyrosine-type recombinase/integrase n=1 Tax=Caulobacter sp. BE254 TaxID=2817720 RepID=UPI00286D4CF4|nr:site-specific integrase [Caulobacter sp. BE254]